MFEPLHVALYMERRPFTEEWLRGLLFRLWERGLHYNYDYAAAPLTWEEELNVLVEGSADREGYRSVQLNALIQHIVAAGSGLITVYDKKVALNLFLDPSGQPDGFDGPDDFPIRFGQVGFSINGPFLDTYDQLPLSQDLPIHAYLLAPYQQVMLAGAHWMEVLCEECNPIFGLGYDTNRESAEEDEREVIEAPLFEGRLPEQTEWRSLTYISARFLDNDFILSLLDSPGRWLKRMKDGGVLMHTPYKEYTYENAEAYRHIHQGEMATEQHEFALATRHHRRAMGIFRAISNNLGERQSGLEIGRVDMQRKIETGDYEKEVMARFDTDEKREAKGMGLVPLSVILPFLEWLRDAHPEARYPGKLSDGEVKSYLHEFELTMGVEDKHLVND